MSYQSSDEEEEGFGAHSSSATDNEEDEDIAEGMLTAFYAMERRRWRRVHNGRSMSGGIGSHVWNAAHCLIMFLVFCHWFDFPFKSIRQYYSIPIALSAILLLWTLVQSVKTPEHLFTTWLTTEVYVFLLWLGWTYDPLVDEACTFLTFWSGQCEDSDLQWRVFRLYLFLASVVLTVFLKFLLRNLVPCMLHAQCRHWARRHWWNVCRLPEPGAQRYSYRPNGLLSCRRAKFTWKGETDELGRPHGKGYWSDSSFHGECLCGSWVHGEPAGVFTSRESGTGAQFKQLAVGYATARADCPPGDLSAASMLPCKASGLRFGLAHVEVSFAGGFFGFLPSVEQHKQQADPEALVRELYEEAPEELHSRRNIAIEVASSEELRQLGEMGDEVRHLQIPVYFRGGSPHGITTVEELGEGEARCLVERSQEALVFIHGYNCDLATALGRLAQTFALGNMPPHIVPFVFSYSAGCALAYFPVQWRMMDYGGDLASFLDTLGRHFSEMHFLVHSCGAEFFFSNWPKIADCFRPVQRRWSRHWIAGIEPRSEPSDHRLHLATLTLINPDVLVATVAERLPEVMLATEHFTTYNDMDDGALFMSECFSAVLPKSLQGGARAGVSRGSSAIFGRCVSPLWLEHTAEGVELRGPMVERAKRNRKRLFSPWTSQDIRRLPHVYRPDSITVIDSSGIDQNVHNLRHNYYMLNTQMVEDVCELIGYRRAAHHRQRLVQVEGNVFNFLSPPSHLKE